MRRDLFSMMHSSVNVPHQLLAVLSVEVWRALHNMSTDKLACTRQLHKSIHYVNRNDAAKKIEICDLKLR